MKRKFKISFTATWLILGFADHVNAQVATGPEVWVGAPYDGNWPTAAGCTSIKRNKCSLPYKHWMAFGGDWSVDLPKNDGADVFLYVAPDKAGSVDVTTKVASIVNACKFGRKGGKAITINVYADKKLVGHLAYLHLNPIVKVGDIGRWGSKLGTVFKADQTDELCWTGPHVHLEVGSQSGYACYNKDWKPLQAIQATNFLGFVTGNRANKFRSKCP